MNSGPRDEKAVSQYIERFAAVMVDSGIPRMPARVFVALLTCDAGRLTAGDLASQLQASPAAVSGGVRYLIQVGLVSREGEPGSRKHVYRVPDDVWNELLILRDRVMSRWTAAFREGIEVLGADTPAGARMAESVRFFEFVSSDLADVLVRWQRRKDAARAEPARPA